MSFLTPLYLIGALGLAIPVILHLLHDRPKNKQAFGSLMFLDKTKPPVDRKRRPTNLLLLLLRCLALLLLAFVFARPYVTVDDPAAADKRDRQWLTVLLDQSASMQRGDLWQKAKARVETALGQLGPGDHFTLYAYGDVTELLVDVETWQDSASMNEVTEQLERLAKPGFGGSNLGQALVMAGEAIQEKQAEPDEQPLAKREILVVSDLQKGSQLGEVQGYEWPTGIKVSLEQIGEDDQGNCGMEQVAARTLWAATESVPSFRISNSPNASTDEFEFVAQSGGDPLSQKVHVPPGRSRVIEMPSEWLEKNIQQLSIRGDAAEFDNTFHFAQERQQTVRIVYIGEDKPNDAEGSLFYLQSAFQKTSALDFAVQAVSGQATSALPEADLYVVDGEASESLAGALDKAIRGGATAVAIVHSAKQTANLKLWLDAPDLIVQNVKSKDYGLLQSLKLDHPVLSVFRDSRYSDFTNLHFWNYRELQSLPSEGVEVLARFDTGPPAWMLVPRDAGRLMVMTAGWRPSDSQLALSTKFIPLLYSILQPVLEAKTQSHQFFVSDRIDVTRFNNGEVSGSVTIKPSGEGDATVETADIFLPTAPGLYTASGADWSETFAVNLLPAESRTEPIPLDQFQKLGLPMDEAVASPGQLAADTATEEKTEANRREYWQWALAAVLLFVTLETALAALGSRSAEPVMTS
ncbi:MAG: hypothetical protein CMO63_03175 [Verrucomicrobiales bacterium]|nr:hypothetical protein [Verrucomicrobiales bacterium]